MNILAFIPYVLGFISLKERTKSRLIRDFFHPPRKISEGYLKQSAVLISYILPNL
jgi:hypothetical protein